MAPAILVGVHMSLTSMFFLNTMYDYIGEKRSKVF